MRMRLALFALLLASGSVHAQATNAVVEPPDSTRRRHIARRTSGPITVDGQLAERDWLDAPVANDFVQVRPDFVKSTAFPSEVRVLFDDRNLYVAAYNRDRASTDIRIPDLRRDFEASDSDVFGVTFGPLGDRRTAFQLQVNPLGAQSDVQAFDGGNVSNFNWDAMWTVRTSRSDSGWVAEMAIPWTSIRYVAGLRSWGVNFVRNARRAAQWSAWMPYPRQFSSWRLTFAGVLDSIQPPAPRANIRVRPYSLVQAERDESPGGTRAATGNVGGEVIWAPTANSLVEATINTDFAQADVDRQVVNLTRFNVFLPERRQFFLENADLLNAGGLSFRYVLQPFFSRSIGLSADGVALPIHVGARYAYRSGRTSAGTLAVRQGPGRGEPGATFGIARGSRFVGRATRAGATIAIRRDDAMGGADPATNIVTAVDALGRIGEQVQFNGMISTSSQDGRTGVAATYFAGRDSPRLYTGFLGAIVSKDYNPRTGFVSRSDVIVTSPAVTWTLQPSWRPRNIVWLRPGVTTYFYHALANARLQEGIVTLRSEVLHRSGASWQPYVEMDFQRPEQPVTLFPGVTIAPGTHDYRRVGIDLRSDQSAQFAATVNVSTGSFFDGSLRQGVFTARWSPSPFVALRGNYEVNRFASLGGRDTSLTTHLAAPELRVFVNPRVQWSAFYQYNTIQERGTLNARFAWEFAPLSYLYVVYNDRRAVSGAVAPTAGSLIVKVSWLRQL